MSMHGFVIVSNVALLPRDVVFRRCKAIPNMISFAAIVLYCKQLCGRRLTNAALLARVCADRLRGEHGIPSACLR